MDTSDYVVSMGMAVNVARLVVGVNDLFTKNPELAAQWHPTLNGELTPRDVTVSAGTKAQWKCAKGHVWAAAIYSRSNGTGCPICVGKAVLSGYNDLTAVNPEIAAQWHPTRNGSITPNEVIAGSSKKFWWLCSLHHEWETTPRHRLDGSGCPYCAGQSILVGFNDLATINPAVAAQWHPTKNGMVTPKHVTSGTNKKFWWVCSFDHEWESSVKTRSLGCGCPKCSGREPVLGVTDLATVNPTLSTLWHPSKNASLAPHHVTAGSNRKIWWLCNIGHEWETQVSKRSRGDGCPFCSNKRVLVGFNDLLTTNPEIAAQWHPTKNIDLTPKDVSAGSHHKAVWLCPLSHEWTVSVVKRFVGRGCPTCAGKSVVAGFNDLQTTNPDLAAQWHPTRNKKLTPQCVTSGSQKRAWWVCPLSHEWEAQISSRSTGVGCSVCDGKKVLRGFNDLTTSNPNLAAQWHPTRNGVLTPHDVTQGSNQKVWWKCKLSHEWEAAVSNRSAGRGCPKCYVRTTEKGFCNAFMKISGLDFESIHIPLIRSSRKSNRAQIDMLNNDLKLVIEYDGEWGHGSNSPDGRTAERKLADDKETTQALVDIGYNVIRIREYSNKAKLPFVVLDPKYESNVFQISYKSFGKDKDDIEELAKRIINEKEDWFKANNPVAL